MYNDQLLPGGVASTGVFNQDWRNHYRAAVFEKDRAKVAGMILDAERVIIIRVRSLFHDQECASEERRALDAALYALQVLKQYSSPAS